MEDDTNMLELHFLFSEKKLDLPYLNLESKKTLQKPKSTFIDSNRVSLIKIASIHSNEEKSKNSKNLKVT